MLAAGAGVLGALGSIGALGYITKGFWGPRVVRAATNAATNAALENVPGLIQAAQDAAPAVRDALEDRVEQAIGHETAHRLRDIGNRVSHLIASHADNSSNEEGSRVSRVLDSVEGGLDMLAPRVPQTAVEAARETAEVSHTDYHRALRESDKLDRPNPIIEQSHNHKTRSKKALTTTVILLFCKFMYKTFKSYGAHLHSFDSLVSRLEKEPDCESLQGNADVYVKAFIKVLKESMHENQTPWTTTLIIQATISPIVFGILKNHLPTITKRVYEHVTKDLYSRASDSMHSQANQSIVKATNIFQNLVDRFNDFVPQKGSLKEEVSGKEAQLFEHANGTIEERKKHFQHLTCAFVDKYIKPIALLEQITQIQEKLIERSKRPDATHYERVILRPLIMFARFLLFIAKGILTPFIMLLNEIIKGVFKAIAIHNTFLEDFTHGTIDMLSGQDLLNVSGLNPHNKLKDDGTGTLMLDTFFKVVLDLANTEIEALLEKGPVQSTPETGLSSEAKKQTRDFLEKLLEVSSKYAGKKSLKEVIIAFAPAGLGQIAVDQGISALVPVLHSIIDKVTTEEFIDLYLAEGLESLNKSLATADFEERRSDEDIQKLKDEAVIRKNRLDGKLDVLGDNLRRLSIQALHGKFSLHEYNIKALEEMHAYLRSFRFEEGKLKPFTSQCVDENLDNIKLALRRLEDFKAKCNGFFLQYNEINKALRTRLTELERITNEIKTEYKAKEQYLLSLKAPDSIDALVRKLKDLNDKIEASDNPLLKDFKQDLIDLARLINGHGDTEYYSKMKNDLTLLIQTLVKKDHQIQSISFAHDLSRLISTFAIEDNSRTIQAMFASQEHKHPFATAKDFLTHPDIKKLIEEEDSKLERYQHPHISIGGEIFSIEEVYHNLHSQITALSDRVTRNRIRRIEIFKRGLRDLEETYKEVAQNGTKSLDRYRFNIEQLTKKLKSSHKAYDDFIKLKNTPHRPEDLELFKQSIAAKRRALSKALQREIPEIPLVDKKVAEATSWMLRKGQSLLTAQFTERARDIVDFTESRLFTTKVMQQLLNTTVSAH